MKRWKHHRITGVPCAVYIVPQADYRKIMAVYRAASIVSSFVITSPFMNERQCDAIEALDIAIERAEK